MATPASPLLPNQPPNGPPRPRIVLGIDYGTTYTGLAWMNTTDQLLLLFENWPEKITPKVPSEYSYSKTSSTKRAENWGHSFDDHAEIIKWSKLDLEPRAPGRELEVLRELVKGLGMVDGMQQNPMAAITNDLPRHITKSAEDVVTDYLREIARLWYNHMNVDARHALENAPIDIIITHPVSWSYEAMNKTFRAVTSAFNKMMLPTRRNIAFTTEAEACALYTVRDMLNKSHNQLIPGDCVVVCDAGGGTVDLASYRIETIQPLILTRVAGMSGGKCGATLIDKAFLEWLRPKLKDPNLLSNNFGTGGHIILTPKGRVVMGRFERVKHEFDGSGSGNVTLPSSLRNEIAPGHESSVRNGILTLTTADLKGIFTTCVEGTQSLIAQQVQQVENSLHGGQVRSIFLSGGLSENEYLFGKVKEWTDSTARIHIQRAEDCWSGVVKGAVLQAMGMGMDAPPDVTQCLRHYGVALSESYTEEKHVDGAQHAFISKVDKRTWIPGRLIWAARKGDVILSKIPLTRSIAFSFIFASRNELEKGYVGRVAFVASDMDMPPSHLSGFGDARTETVQLRYDLSKIPKHSIQRKQRSGGHYYLAPMVAEFKISRHVDVKINCGGETLISCHTSL